MLDTMQRVVFDKDTGKIKSIGPGTPVENSIQVPLSDVIDFKTGNRSRLKYRVEFNIEKKKYEIVEKKKSSTKIQNFLYEIPIAANAELLIIKDVKNNCWKIKLDKSVRHLLKENTVSTDQLLPFSITEYGDPNILYKYFTINMLDLIKQDITIDFTMPFETQQQELSIFTRKVFKTYGAIYEI